MITKAMSCNAEQDNAHPGRLIDGLMDVVRDVEHGDDEHTERLATAINTLLYFSFQKGLTESGEETVTAIVYLLADLMHLAHHIGLEGDEFDSMITTASMHFKDESD